MKTSEFFKLSILALFISSIFLSSCKSDDDAGGGGGAAMGTITSKIDGQSISTLEMTTNASLVSGNLSIQGNTGGTDAKSLTLLILGVDGTGTYPLGGGANILNSASYSELNISIPNESQIWQAPYDDSQVGEIQISELTETRVKGTFQFSAKNTIGDQSVKNITEGSFHINF